MPVDVPLGAGRTGADLLNAFPGQYRDAGEQMPVDNSTYMASMGPPQLPGYTAPAYVTAPYADPDQARGMQLVEMPGVGQVVMPVEHTMVGNPQMGSVMPVEHVMADFGKLPKALRIEVHHFRREIAEIVAQAAMEGLQGAKNGSFKSVQEAELHVRRRVHQVTRQFQQHIRIGAERALHAGLANIRGQLERILRRAPARRRFRGSIPLGASVGDWRGSGFTDMGITTYERGMKVKGAAPTYLPEAEVEAIERGTTLSNWRGSGFANMGAPAEMSERDMVLSLRNTYIKTADEMRKHVFDAALNIRDFLGAYQKYKKEVGKQIAKRLVAEMGGLGWMFQLGRSVQIATETVGAAEKASRATEQAKKIYNAVTDTIKRTDAAWEAFEGITMADLEGEGILTGKTIEQFAARLKVSPNVIRGLNLLAATTGWAQQLDIAFEPALGAARSLGKLLSDVETDLRTLAEATKPEARRVPGTPEYIRERNVIQAQIKKEFLASLSKAYRESLERKREPGVLESAFNWIVNTVKTALSYAYFALGIVPGMIGYFMGFKLVQWDDMSKAAYAAGRLIVAAQESIAAGTLTFTATYKKARIEDKEPEPVAQKKAIAAAKDQIKTTGGPAFDAANKDIDRHLNHALKVQQAFDDIAKSLTGIIEKVLLYGGIAAAIVVITAVAI